MSRRHVTFACRQDTLVGTLDEAAGTCGLLLVTGGNEARAGAFSGQAELAARLAARGHPVFRFDRRGTGDSSGHDPGFRASGADIAAALGAFRAEAPHVKRVISFGNCNAASTLMLTGGAGLNGLVLANPWTFESDSEDRPTPAAVRARYAEKLRNPRELARLLSGKVSLARLFEGLRQALRPTPPPSTLAEEMAHGLAGFTGPVSVLLAGRDRTAQAFREAWDVGDPRIATCPGASHSFSEAHARDWLFERVLAALSE
jgi:exosortase A-associated hydrolase 1